MLLAICQRNEIIVEVAARTEDDSEDVFDFMPDER
jgi:hypothetical protein